MKLEMKKQKLQQTMEKYKEIFVYKEIRDYYQQLYANKMFNLEEMNIFLEKFSLPRLNQEETEIMSKPIINTEIKTRIKKSPQNKSPGPDGSQVNSTKHLEKS